MPTHRITKYLFTCEKCGNWYTTNEVLETCGGCGRPVREATEDEKEYFYYRLSRQGYRLIPLERQRKRRVLQE